MSEQGIDITKSGWENPDGFKPRERDHVPPATPACEAAGPNGWVCDLAKGHPGNAHNADGGPTWPVAGRRSGPWKSGDVVSTADMEPARMAMDVQDALDPGPVRDALLDVNTTAQTALADPSPAAWAVALAHIVEMTRGY